MKTNIQFFNHILSSSSWCDKCFRQKLLRKSKHIFVFSFFFCENRAIYEIMWKNIVAWGRPQMPIWHMLIACCIHNATNTNSEYVRLIAFPLQQWLHGRPSVLRYTYIASLVKIWERRIDRFTGQRAVGVR